MIRFSLKNITAEDTIAMLNSNNKLVESMYKIRTIFTAYKPDSEEIVYERNANVEDDFLIYQEEIKTKLKINDLEFTVLYLVEDDVERWAFATIEDLKENKIVYDMQKEIYIPGEWETTFETIYRGSSAIVSSTEKHRFEQLAGKTFWYQNRDHIIELFDNTPKCRLEQNFTEGETAIVGDRLILSERTLDHDGTVEYRIFDLLYSKEVFNVITIYNIIKTFKIGDWENYLSEYYNNMQEKENKQKSK